MNTSAEGIFDEPHRVLAAQAFGRRRADLDGAVVVQRGTVVEADRWLAIATRRRVLASILTCPAFLSNSRTHALGLGPAGVALVRYEPFGLPPRRRSSEYPLRALTVTDVRDGPFTTLLLDGEEIQAEHDEAALVGRVLRALLAAPGHGD